MKTFKFSKRLVETSYEPVDTNALWISIEEGTGKINSIKEFKHNKWKEILVKPTEEEMKELVLLNITE